MDSYAYRVARVHFRKKIHALSNTSSLLHLGLLLPHLVESVVQHDKRSTYSTPRRSARRALMTATVTEVTGTPPVRSPRRFRQQASVLVTTGTEQICWTWRPDRQRCGRRTVGPRYQRHPSRPSSRFPRFSDADGLHGWPPARPCRPGSFHGREGSATRIDDGGGSRASAARPGVPRWGGSAICSAVGRLRAPA